MAIVSLKSNLFRDQQAGGPVNDPLIIKGVRRAATGKVENGAADSNLSKYKLISLPSYVILDSSTIFHVENWGFAAIRIGTLTTVGALVSVLKSAATTQAPVTAVGQASANRLWQLLGLASDPNEEIDIYAHAIADATGAGNMPFRIGWIDRV